MESYIFGQVPSTEAGHAFAFHRRIATSNAHIWPRSEEEIHQYVEAGQVFGARRTETFEFVALCYVAADHDEQEFELGGLITDTSVRRIGIGTLLTRLAIAHTMAFERPWDHGQELIAHVREANADPRNLLRTLGFEFYKTVSVPPAYAPASMKRNSAGQIVGDKFRFTREGLIRVSGWLRGFNGTLDGSDIPAVLDLVLLCYKFCAEDRGDTEDHPERDPQHGQ